MKAASHAPAARGAGPRTPKGKIQGGRFAWFVLLSLALRGALVYGFDMVMISSSFL